MLENLLANVETYLTTNPWLACLGVFAGGVTTAANPCVLAMIPLMMAFVAGSGKQQVGPLRAFGFSLIFVLGLSLTFTTLGITAALAGSLYGDLGGVWNWVVACVCLLMGLHLWGLLSFRINLPVDLNPRKRGALGAFLLGLLFGFVSAPCAAPILVVLLTYIAGSGASIPYGGLLLLLYGLGHSVLIIAGGTSMGLARKLIESKNFHRASAVMNRAAGSIIILVGLFFAFRGLR